MRKIMAAIATMAMALGLAVPAIAADTSPVVPGLHLDLTTGFSSDNNSYQQFYGTWNYDGTLRLGLNRHLEVNGTLGGDSLYTVTAQSGNLALPALSTPTTTIMTYRLGVKYALSPNMNVQASYGQDGNSFYVAPSTNVVRGFNVQTNVRAF